MATAERSARFAAAAATLCAVHCALTPVLAAAVPFLAATHSVEVGALALTVTLGGGITLFSSAWKHPVVVFTLLLGAGIWAASLMGVFEPLPEVVTSPVGSLIFAAGMIGSARICRAGDCDRCEPGDVAPR